MLFTLQTFAVFFAVGVLGGKRGTLAVLVYILLGADDVCIQCPNRRENGCVSDEKVKEYDSRILKACGLKYGEILSWEEFTWKVRKKIISGIGREKICPDCQWSNICKKNKPQKAEERKDRSSRPVSFLAYPSITC